jgi:hypothetical protein
VLLQLFPGFRFEHPINGRQMHVGGLSYLWAALLGPIYVLSFRRGGGLRSLAITIAHTVALVLIFGASTYLPSVQAFLMLLVLVPAVFVAHGRATLFIVKDTLARRGWMVTRD